MAIVKLGEVARESKLSYKGDKSTMKIVGLEHLTPESVTLTEWSGNTENTFTKRFLKGQILFGRRRAYLKKAAVAPFDGICSGDITVIEAIPWKINDQLLPFIIQNERFFDYAVEKSAGSLSPRVKWEHLKDYEFELPDMTEQERLAKILWAAEDLKLKYSNAMKNSNYLLKKISTNMLDSNLYKSVELSNIAEYVRGLTYSASEESTCKTKFAVLRANNINKDDFMLNFEDLKYISSVKNENAKLLEDDILVCAANGSKDHIGKFAFIDSTVDAYFGGFMGVIRCNKNMILPEFLYYCMHSEQYAKYIEKVIAGTNIINLKAEHFMSYSIKLPSIEFQKNIVHKCRNIKTLSQFLANGVKKVNVLMSNSCSRG